MYGGLDCGGFIDRDACIEESRIACISLSGYSVYGVADLYKEAPD